MATMILKAGMQYISQSGTYQGKTITILYRVGKTQRWMVSAPDGTQWMVGAWALSLWMQHYGKNNG